MAFEFCSFFLSLCLVTALTFVTHFSQPVSSSSSNNSRTLPEPLSVFSTAKLPRNQNLYATIANGYAGMAVLSDTIYISGVYNGGAARDNTSDVSHRARLPSTNSFTATFPDFLNSSISALYTLDVNYGEFRTDYTFSNGSETVFNVSIICYAHRSYRNLLVTNILVNNTGNDAELEFELHNKHGASSDDLAIDSFDCDSTGAAAKYSKYGKYSKQHGMESKHSSSDACGFEGMKKYCELGRTYVSEGDSELISVAMVSFAGSKFDFDKIKVAAGDYQSIYIPTVLLTSLEVQGDDQLKEQVMEYYNDYCQDITYQKVLLEHRTQWDYIWKNGVCEVYLVCSFVWSVRVKIVFFLFVVNLKWCRLQFVCLSKMARKKELFC